MPIITINNVAKEYKKGTKFEDIAKEYQSECKYRIAAVLFNGKIRELMKEVKKDGEVSFLTFGDNIGHKTMRRTAVMMFVKAIRDVAGKEPVILVPEGDPVPACEISAEGNKTKLLLHNVGLYTVVAFA